MYVRGLADTRIGRVGRESSVESIREFQILSLSSVATDF
jgi:hypothetical protein